MAALTFQSAPVPSVSPSPAVWQPSALLNVWRLSWGASWARQSGTRCACLLRHAPFDAQADSQVLPQVLRLKDSSPELPTLVCGPQHGSCA